MADEFEVFTFTPIGVVQTPFDDTQQIPKGPGAPSA
jgi:hypothetical protein